MVSVRDRDVAKLTGSLGLNAPNSSKPLASPIVGKKNGSQKKKTRSQGKMTRAQKKRTRSQKKKSKSKKKKANSQEKKTECQKKKTKSPEEKTNLNSEREPYTSERCFGLLLLEGLECRLEGPDLVPWLEPAGQGFLVDEFSLMARFARRFPLPAYLDSGQQFDSTEIVCPNCKQRGQLRSARWS